MANVVAKNTGFQYLLQIAKYLFPFITLPYLARVFAPDVYAVRAYVVAVMSLLQVLLDYGFNYYGTQVVASSRDDSTVVNELATSITLLRVAMCFIGFAILQIVVFNVDLLKQNLLFAELSYFTICLRAMLPDFIFQGQEDMGIMTYRYVVSQLVVIPFYFLLIHGPEDLMIVAYLEITAALIALVWSWANCFRKRNVRFIRVAIKRIKSDFESASMFFLSFAATHAYTALTTVFIGLCISDNSQISFWSLSVTAVTAAVALYDPIVNSLYPHVVANKDFSLVKKGLLIGIPVVICGTLAFVLLRDQIMWVLGGDEYLQGSYILALLSPVLLFAYPVKMIGFPVLAASGRVEDVTKSSVISALFHIVGLIVLAISGWFSIVLVAVLRDCTEAVLLLMRIVYVYRQRDRIRGTVEHGS